MLLFTKIGDVGDTSGYDFLAVLISRRCSFGFVCGAIECSSIFMCGFCVTATAFRVAARRALGNAKRAGTGIGSPSPGRIAARCSTRRASPRRRETPRFRADLPFPRCQKRDVGSPGPRVYADCRDGCIASSIFAGTSHAFQYSNAPARHVLPRPSVPHPPF